MASGWITPTRFRHEDGRVCEVGVRDQRGREIAGFFWDDGDQLHSCHRVNGEDLHHLGIMPGHEA